MLSAAHVHARDMLPREKILEKVQFGASWCIILIRFCINIFLRDLFVWNSIRYVDGRLRAFLYE